LVRIWIGAPPESWNCQGRNRPKRAVTRPAPPYKKRHATRFTAESAKGA
jgi:hypothetical protein